jgi:site-specific DNA-methyltransferase (adenine-specific)
MAMAEYAWASFNANAKVYDGINMGLPGQRFHPTQKPVALYEFCLRHFAKPGDKILDTHAGSGSCLIAAHRFGHQWLGFELDPDYHRLATERIEREMAQGQLFEPPEARAEPNLLF